MEQNVSTVEQNFLFIVKFKKLEFSAPIIPFRASRVSGVHLRGFAPGFTHQGCSGGESLATRRRFDRFGI